MTDISDHLQEYKGNLYLKLEVKDLSIIRNAGNISHYGYEINTGVGIVQNPEHMAKPLNDQEFNAYEDNWRTGKMFWNGIVPLIYSDSLEPVRGHDVYQKKSNITFPPSNDRAKIGYGRTVYQTAEALVIGHNAISNILSFDNVHKAGHWATTILNGMLRETTLLHASSLNFVLKMNRIPLTDEAKTKLENITEQKVTEYFFTKAIHNLYQGRERVEKVPHIPKIFPLPS
tara:strand:+ start:16999 stop:17688 length:690 start_codon:yes stop_codon:yes gene_type:complete